MPVLNSDPTPTTATRPDDRIAWGLSLLLAGGLFLAVGCVLILASVPPVSRDALVHHLTLPRLYLEHGGIYEIPHMFFSYYPMNLDLLYLIPLYFGNDIAAKYIHFSFALLTAGLIYRYLAQRLNRTCALAGALFFLTIPVIVKLSITVYVDLGLVFFSWAALYLVLRWHDTGFAPRFLAGAGIACGLALGTKYNGLILLPILGSMVPLLYARQKNRDVPRDLVGLRHRHALSGLAWAVVFILTALVVFSPWMVRNIIWTQNPVYPLYKRIFSASAPAPSNAGSAEVEKEKKPPKNAFWVRRHVYRESFIETLTIPVRAFFQGQDDNPQYFDGRLNPFLLLLPLIAFLPAGKSFFKSFSVHRAVLGLFALLYMLFVFFQADFRIRYMAPAIPPLVILSIFGLKALADRASLFAGPVKKAGWAAVILLFLLALLYNENYVYGQFGHIRPFDYLSGKVDRDAYISRFRPEYPVIQYANRTLPENARVLCLSVGNRTYYLDRQAHLAMDFFDKPGAHYSEADLLNKLTRYGTTHVLLDRAVFFNWLRVMPQADQELFLGVFKKYTRTLYQENDVLLLALDAG